jgi:long-chain acyl-CoA synthetase
MSGSMPGMPTVQAQRPASATSPADTAHGATPASDGSTAAWAAALAASCAHDTVLRRFLAQVAARPAAVAHRDLAAGGAAADRDVAWAEWAREARMAAAALVAGGLACGDRVAILAGNTPLWPMLELAVLMAGGVSVGVFPTCTAEQLREVLADCGARVLVVAGTAQLEKARAACARPSDPTASPQLVADSCDSVEEAVDAGASADASGATVRPLSAWMATGARALAVAVHATEVDRRVRAARPDDVAALIYTSGSTGEPKGACIPHAYLLASAESIQDTLGLTTEDRALALLPFAHAAERVFGLHTRVVCGMTGGLVRDAARTWEAARAFHPTLLGLVPRFYERLYEAVRAAAPGERRAVVAAHVGDAVRLATSGGASLPPTVAEGLRLAGLTVLGAYGQTEHLCVAFQRPGDAEHAGVGRPMPGTELRIAEDGEILVRRSALTFGGYLGRPAATDEAFTPDGMWLRTGDLGTVDAHGRLHVTGRKKELLALSTGKKVAPLPIEARLAEHPAVAQAVLVGDGRRFIVALLFVPRGAAGAADGELRATLAEHVAAVNATLAPHERVARFAVVPGELTIEGGMLTPTLKVRRAAVEAHHHAALEALYA